MVGNIAHVIIDIMLEVEEFFHYRAELDLHMVHVFRWRLDSMVAPHHHRSCTDFALGNPADLVFVEPLGDLGGFT